MTTGPVQDWQGVVTAIGSLSTAASVMVAFWSYQRTHDQSRFSEFRGKLTELKTTINEVDLLLDERALSLLADRIAGEVCAIASPSGDYAEIKAFLLSEGNNNRLVQAVYRGIDGSVLVSRLDMFRRLRDLTVNQFIGQFPVFMRFVSDLSRVTVKSGRELTRARIYLTVLRDKKMMQRLIDGVERGGKANAHELRMEMIDVLSEFPVTMLTNTGQLIINHCKDGMSLLVDKLVESPDHVLRSLEKRDRARQSKLKSTGTVTGDLKANVRLVRDMLNGSERGRLDKVVEGLTSILETPKPQAS